MELVNNDNPPYDYNKDFVGDTIPRSPSDYPIDPEHSIVATPSEDPSQNPSDPPLVDAKPPRKKKRPHRQENRRLSPQQLKFIEEYSISGNAYDAAIKAGYSESFAKVDVYRSLDNPRLMFALGEKLKERSKHYNVDAHYLIKRCIKFLDICEARNDMRAVASIVDQLAKLTGSHHETRIRLLGDSNEPIELTLEMRRAQLSDDELAAAIPQTNTLQSTLALPQAAQRDL